MKQVIGLAFQTARPAHNALATELAKGVPRSGQVIHVPVNVAWNKEVLLAITVVIAEGGPVFDQFAERDAGVSSATSVNVPSWLL